jgi:hypothetical protein
MSKITVKGYVNKPSTKAGSKGSFAVFNVTNFNSPTPPEESAFVEVTGYLNFRTYGEGKVSYDINAQEVTVVGSSSDSKASAGTEGVQEKDPWE